MQRSTVSAFTRVFDARCGALLNPGGRLRGSRLCAAPWRTLHRVRDTGVWPRAQAKSWRAGRDKTTRRANFSLTCRANQCF